jgi:hypothetical protein
MKKASGGSATADRQGRALLPGKLKKNLPMIAPQKAYAKGGSVKATAYDKMQDQAMQRHENEPMGKAHARKKAKGGIMEKSSGEKYASKAAMKKHEAKDPVLVPAHGARATRAVPAARRLWPTGH